MSDSDIIKTEMLVGKVVEIRKSNDYSLVILMRGGKPYSMVDIPLSGPAVTIEEFIQTTNVDPKDLHTITTLFNNHFSQK